MGSRFLAPKSSRSHQAPRPRCWQLTKHLVPRCWRGERVSPNTDPRDYVGPVATGVRDRRLSCFVCVCSWFSSLLPPSTAFPSFLVEIRERSGHPKGLPHNILVSRARLITNFPPIFLFPPQNRKSHQKEPQFAFGSISGFGEFFVVLVRGLLAKLVDLPSHRFDHKIREDRAPKRLSQPFGQFSHGFEVCVKWISFLFVFCDQRYYRQ